MNKIKNLILLFIILIGGSLDAQDRYYPLDGNSNEMLNNFNGVFGSGSNAPTAAMDRFNNPNGALNFDGDDYIDIPVTGMTNAEFTVAAWITFPAPSPNLRMWFTVGNHSTTDQFAGIGPSAWGDGLLFSGYRNNQVNYRIYTNGYPPSNQWYYMCCVYSLNYTKLYINGVLIDSSVSNNSLPSYGTNPTALIGSRSLSATGWIGKIDELRYFDHALNDLQVAALLSNESNIIVGSCFIDINGNGVKDSGEQEAPGLEVRSLSSSGHSYSNNTGATGNFRTLVDTGTITTSVQSSNFTSQPVNLISQHSTFGNIDTVDFALTAIPGITDASISLIPITSAVPGFISNYNLICYNNGTDTIGGTIMLVIDQGVFYAGSTPQADSVSGDTLFWFFSSLNPLQTIVINLQLQVAPPPVINMGDTLNLFALVTTPGDVNGENNSAIVNQIVIASHDPNDKSVLEGNTLSPSQVLNGDHLTYLIRFQNTGTASAHNIVVLDSLSTMLDWNTIQMQHASHNYSFEKINGNILKWTFNNIMLPDSNSNEPASHGYVCFTIKPLNSIMPGNVISNKAFIYFDFELPIITNTAEVTILVPTSVEIQANQSENILLYPNPVSDLLKIKGTLSNGKIRIYNSIGELVKELNCIASESRLNVSDFKPGFYSMNYIDSSLNYSIKFFKL